MTETIRHLRSCAGTSYTKASVRHACAMRPVATCQQRQWNKTGSGSTA